MPDHWVVKSTLFVFHSRRSLDTKPRFSKTELTSVTYSNAAKRNLFSKKQSLCSLIIPQYLCKVLAESSFKRSWYKVFKNSTLLIFLPYEYIYGHVSPATLNNNNNNSNCNRQTDRQTDGRTDGRTDHGWMGGWVGGWIDGWMDGWMDR